MEITPLDIQNKQFVRAFRGYDIEAVDDFLDRIVKDLEGLLRENADFRNQLEQLQEKTNSYREMEETMHNAIVLAQKTADEVKQNAKQEAGLIRREAERDAKQIVDDARYRVNSLVVEREELLKMARVFKMRFRSFIESQLAVLESEDWLAEQKVGEVSYMAAQTKPPAEAKPFSSEDLKTGEKEDFPDEQLLKPRLELAHDIDKNDVTD